jgi:hypothetical protein
MIAGNGLITGSNTVSMNYREQFDILFQKISRQGDDGLYNYLSLESDFFTAPASSQYHLNFEGGLMQHSINVANTMIKLNDAFNLGFEESSLILCGLMHDLCKANYYVKESRNVKENGQWVVKPMYVIKEKLGLSHGHKSVILLMQYIKLSQEEMLAICWHMSKWNLTDADLKSYNSAMDYSQLVVLLQLADVAATHILEK